MKLLLEIIENMDHSKRIRRADWPIGIYLVLSLFDNRPLIKLDMHSLQMGEYLFTYEDLVADDWSIG